uniref:DRBM domain-containing protein n=1 Tax=Anopheles farauti TaxID=69004 RepID=A0A182QSL5_9DIPT
MICGTSIKWLLIERLEPRCNTNIQSTSEEEHSAGGTLERMQAYKYTYIPMVFPGSKFTDKRSSDGTSVAKLLIDGKVFTGCASSKKKARVLASKQVCQELFGIKSKYYTK